MVTVVALYLLWFVTLEWIKTLHTFRCRLNIPCNILPLLYQKQDCVCSCFRTTPAHHSGDLHCHDGTYVAPCLYTCCSVSHGDCKRAMLDFYNSIKSNVLNYNNRLSFQGEWGLWALLLRPHLHKIWTIFDWDDDWNIFNNKDGSLAEENGENLWHNNLLESCLHACSWSRLLRLVACSGMQPLVGFSAWHFWL